MLKTELKSGQQAPQHTHTVLPLPAILQALPRGGERERTALLWKLSFSFRDWLEIIPAAPRLARLHSGSKVKPGLWTLLESSKYQLGTHLPPLLVSHHLSMEATGEDYWERQTPGDEITPDPGHFWMNCKSRFLNTQYAQAMRGERPVGKSSCRMDAASGTAALIQPSAAQMLRAMPRSTEGTPKASFFFFFFPQSILNFNYITWSVRDIHWKLFFS